MSPGPVVDPATVDVTVDATVQEVLSAEEATLNEKPLPQEDDALVVENTNDNDKDEDKDDDDDDEDDFALAATPKDSKENILKEILKLGLKPVTGVRRVTIKKAQSVYCFMSRTNVLKSPNSNTYVIIGDAKWEDFGAMMQHPANLLQYGLPPDLQYPPGKPYHSAPAAETQPDDEEEKVDETGLTPYDIDLVMSQARVSRSTAVKALRTHNSDIVTAIMELSAK